MKRPGNLLLVLTLMLASLILHASPAQAYAFSGCKYGNAIGASTPMYYKFLSVGSLYSDAFQQAQSAWDSKSVPGTWIQDDVNGNFVHVESGLYAWDEWARASAPCANGYWQARVLVSFNVNTMQGLDAYQKKLVAIHELGHAYGLAHASMTCGGTPKVMETGEEKFTCSGTPPWGDDVNGVQALY